MDEDQTQQQSITTITVTVICMKLVLPKFTRHNLLIEDIKGKMLRIFD